MGYYGLTIFLSAFLLFQIQPLISKYILPWFGGAPAVWSTSLLFFQSVLLAGYAYAHWLMALARPRKKAPIHLTLVGLSLALLLVGRYLWRSPVLPSATWVAPNSSAPIAEVLRVLAISVGVPYFVLSATSPLVQSWYFSKYPNRSPYLLYAYSNVGSLLALMTYPLLIEPTLALRMQATFWSWGYVVFALAIIYGALHHVRFGGMEGQKGGDPTALRARPISHPAPGVAIRVLWMSFAACASVLLLATTRQISQEIAVIPFLWVLPLTIYLLSFVLCFSGEGWYSRRWYSIALFIASGIFCWTITHTVELNITSQIAAHCLVLFVCCMICHGELFGSRPLAHHLTLFYLLVSAGGALGGGFVTLIAPQLFTGFCYGVKSRLDFLSHATSLFSKPL